EMAVGDDEVVRGFLSTLPDLQIRDRHLDCLQPGPGLMPASFRVDPGSDGEQDRVVADYGQRAIGGVAPVDSALWWLWLLRAHRRHCGRYGPLDTDREIEAVERVLTLYLAPRLERVPALL
ncbi:MAG: glycoside hydrolase 100 family protein, partial [Trueperaceae bacterium]